MITQINAFDRKFLKKGMPITVTQKVRSKIVVFSAIVQAILPLKMTVVYVEGNSVELKDIRPNEIADGSVKIQLMIPYNPEVHGALAETAISMEEVEENAEQ
jgi:hypothetical protein